MVNWPKRFKEQYKVMAGTCVKEIYVSDKGFEIYQKNGMTIWCEGGFLNVWDSNNRRIYHLEVEEV